MHALVIPGNIEIHSVALLTAQTGGAANAADGFETDLAQEFQRRGVIFHSPRVYRFEPDFSKGNIDKLSDRGARNSFAPQVVGAHEVPGHRRLVRHFNI